MLDTQAQKSPDWRGFLYFAGLLQTLRWCPRPDLNRHGLRHYPLKIACLPIPPLGHKLLLRNIRWILSCRYVRRWCATCIKRGHITHWDVAVTLFGSGLNSCRYCCSIINHRDTVRHADARLLLGNYSQTKTGYKKYGCQYGCRSGEKVTSPLTAEYGLRCTGTKRCARLCPFALLQKNQSDNRQCRDHVHYQNDIFHHYALRLVTAHSQQQSFM